jgi:hypothetical protein
VKVDCVGDCAAVSDGDKQLRLSGFKFDREERAGKSIPIVIRRTCQGKKLTPITLRIAFDRVGRVDKTKSKLG